jgi:hypothetical protein
MVRPNDLVSAVLYTLKQSDAITTDVTFIGYEPDIDSEPIKLPIIEVSLGQQIDATLSNTDFVEYVTDDSGDQIGRKFETLYEQEITISAWTAQDSMYEPRSIGDSIRDSIYPHTTNGPNKPLRHPKDNRVLDEVWNVTILEGSHTDELGRTPTLRRWEQTINIAASEQYIVQANELPISAFNDSVNDE